MRFPTTPGLANANLRTLPRKRVTSWEGCSTRNPTMGILNKKKCGESLLEAINHRIHGAAIYGYMDPINIPPMLVYIPYMDPMGNSFIIYMLTLIFFPEFMLWFSSWNQAKNKLCWGEYGLLCACQTGQRYWQPEDIPISLKTLTVTPMFGDQVFQVCSWLNPLILLKLIYTY